MARDSAKNRIREFLVAQVGEVVTAAQLQQVAAPVSEWACRVRELREQEGWPIATHNDDVDLKPGQYVLTELPAERSGIKFDRGISQKLRVEVLDRNGFTCQSCGKTPGKSTRLRAGKLGCISPILLTGAL